MTDHDDIEPPHASSATDLVLNELQLFGYRPFDDQPDPRPLPEGKTIASAVADIFDALVATLNDTRLEPDLPDLLWSTVNLFHRAADRINRQLDDNEQTQRKSQREQNGSEVRSVELERLTAEGITLIERRNCFELFRDQAIELFEVHTGSAWRPRSGSLVNHRTLTAALIDSRDFIAAKRRADTEVMLPAGPKVALTGGLDFNDHRLIWDRLDKVHGKHPDMVLIHGGSPKGAELIASKWATTRKVPQIAFKPDWTKHAKAAPFKRNDAMLELLPIGVMHFPGTGIPAALMTGIRSDLPGQITAQVTEAIFDSPTGRIKLVPQGARLIGIYDSQVAFGQSRVLLVWTRLIMPNGRSIVLERQPGADVAGYSGLEDQVDNHWKELLGAAALSTLLAVGTEVNSGTDVNNSNNAIIQALRRGAGDSLNQTGQQVVRRNLNIQPTLTIRPGFPVRVIVNRDLVLEPFRG